MRLTTDEREVRDPPQALAAVQSMPRGWAIAAVVAGLLIVFVLDRVTNAAPVQHLYDVPIILAAVRFGMPGGVLGSLAAIALYHLANPRLLGLGHTEADGLQLVLFAVTGPVVAKLAQDARRMHRLAMTDDLTGLDNLRSFERRLASLIREARGDGATIALLVMDLDRLKSLNDTHGHLAGAEAVRTVGQLIGEGLPAGAVACRYGGDEFVVAIVEGPTIHAHDVAEDLRRAVAATEPVLAGTPFPAGRLTISIGVARRTFDAGAAGSDGDAGEALFRQADEALYVAKARGRNGVHVA